MQLGCVEAALHEQHLCKRAMDTTAVGLPDFIGFVTETTLRSLFAVWAICFQFPECIPKSALGGSRLAFTACDCAAHTLDVVGVVMAIQTESLGIPECLELGLFRAGKCSSCVLEVTQRDIYSDTVYRSGDDVSLVALRVTECEALVDCFERGEQISG